MDWLLKQMMSHLTNLKKQEAAIKNNGILVREDSRKLIDIQCKIASTKAWISEHDVLFICKPSD